MILKAYLVGLGLDTSPSRHCVINNPYYILDITLSIWPFLRLSKSILRFLLLTQKNKQADSDPAPSSRIYFIKDSKYLIFVLFFHTEIVKSRPHFYLTFFLAFSHFSSCLDYSSGTCTHP